MVAGGYDDNTELDLDSVEILELSGFSSQWILLSQTLPSPLFKPSLVTLGGFPYLLGGTTTTTIQSGIFKFNLDQPSQHWTKVSDLLTPRYLFSASLVNFEEIKACCSTTTTTTTTTTTKEETNNDLNHDDARIVPSIQGKP